MGVCWACLQQIYYKTTIYMKKHAQAFAFEKDGLCSEGTFAFRALNLSKRKGFLFFEKKTNMVGKFLNFFFWSLFAFLIIVLP